MSELIGKGPEEEKGNGQGGVKMTWEEVLKQRATQMTADLTVAKAALQGFSLPERIDYLKYRFARIPREQAESTIYNARIEKALKEARKMTRNSG